MRFQNSGTANETGRYIRRNKDLTGQAYANLRFQLRGIGLTSADRLAVEVSNDGVNWFRLQELRGDLVSTAYSNVSASAAFNISPYISANTAIRFVILTDITGTDLWALDNVHIDYAVGGDWDMTGARLATCDGVKLAVAWGQDPAHSGGNDEEALDMGTGIAPFGSDIAIDKSADKTMVAQGGLVNYTFLVTNRGGSNLDERQRHRQQVLAGGVRLRRYQSRRRDAEPLPGGDLDLHLLQQHLLRHYQCGLRHWDAGELYARPSTARPTSGRSPLWPPAVVGNYVWLDEDGDGDQDAGEAGIPNVPVTLTGTDTFGNAGQPAPPTPTPTAATSSPVCRPATAPAIPSR